MSLANKQQIPWRHLILLVVFSLPLFFIKISDKQTWGDDFAQYIQEGKNIAEGKPYYSSTYIFNDLNQDYAPAEYPPGFPLMLAPVIYFSGIQIAPMLFLISFLLATLLFILFFYYRTLISDRPALLLALVSVYCAGVINLKGYVLSDLPLLVLTALYFLLRNTLRFTLKDISLLSLVATFSLLTRSQAIILMAAEFFWLSIILCSGRFDKSAWHKVKPSLSVLVFTMSLYLVVKSFFLRASHDPVVYYSSFFQQYEGRFWTIVGENVGLWLNMFSELFVYQQDNKTIQWVSQLFSYAIAFVALIGCGAQFRRGARVEFIFFLLMCLLIILLPVRQGLRFFIPVIPAYFFLVCSGWKLLQDRFRFAGGWKVVVVLCVAYLLSGFRNFTSAPFEDWTPYNRADSVAFEYLRQKIKPNEVVVFTKPRALALFTNLTTMNIAWKRNATDNKRKFDSVDVKYMLTRDDVDFDLIERYLREVPPVDTTKIGVYTLYRVR